MINWGLTSISMRGLRLVKPGILWFRWELYYPYIRARALPTKALTGDQ